MNDNFWIFLFALIVTISLFGLFCYGCFWLMAQVGG